MWGQSGEVCIPNILFPVVPRHIDFLGFGPQAVDVVVRADGMMEHVDDDVSQINQDPSSTLRALHSVGLNSLAFEVVQNGICDRTDLSVRRRAADENVVGVGDELLDVEDREIGRLLVEGNLCDPVGELKGVYGFRPPCRGADYAVANTPRILL